jgi:periplasmic protein TonB
MSKRKDIKVDNDKVKRNFTTLGLSLISGIVLAAFTYGNVNTEKHPIQHISHNEDIEIEYEEMKPIENTPPPPPMVIIPPEMPEEIEEVENKEILPISQVTPPKPPPTVEVSVVEVTPPIVDFPDIEAVFPGGAVEMMKWINDNISYPKTSIEMNEQGRVFLQFVVEKDGSITNVKVDRGVSIDLDREAKRVIKNMPKWVPGEIGGRSIRARCRLPINFQLN